MAPDSAKSSGVLAPQLQAGSCHQVWGTGVHTSWCCSPSLLDVKLSVAAMLGKKAAPSLLCVFWSCFLPSSLLLRGDVKRERSCLAPKWVLPGMSRAGQFLGLCLSCSLLPSWHIVGASQALVDWQMDLLCPFPWMLTSEV